MKLLILMLGVIGGSTSAIFVRFSTAPSMVLVIYRMVITVLLLAPAAWRSRKEFQALPLKSLLLCAASGVALGLHFYSYFEAVKSTSIAASSVLVNIEVLLVALATVLLFRKKLPGRAWLAILLAFCGAVVIALGDVGNGVSTLRGNVIALCSAVLIGTYTLIGSVCRRSVSTTVYTYLVYCMSLVTVLVLTLISGTPILGYGAVNFGAALGMALFCTLMGHSIFSWALKYLPASLVSTIRLLDCVVSTLWGCLIFGEFPSLTAILGGCMVIAGVILYSRTTANET